MVQDVVVWVRIEMVRFCLEMLTGGCRRVSMHILSILPTSGRQSNIKGSNRIMLVHI